MKLSLIIFIPVVLLLTGCPGVGDRLFYDHWRGVHIYGERICFSIDKKEVISNYSLEFNEKTKSIVLLNSGRDAVHLSYPDSCFKVNLKQGYRYGAFYTLDDIKYRYEFIIDNNGTVINLEGVR